MERARRHNQEEIGLRNTLPLMVEGSKARSKRNEVRARRRAQKEVG